jgi:hypothetical protein
MIRVEIPVASRAVTELDNTVHGAAYVTVAAAATCSFL